MVNERIRLINGKLSLLRDDYDNALDIVNRTLPMDLASKVQEHAKVMQDNEFQKTKERHQDKFSRFLEKKVHQDKVARPEVPDEQQKRRVINLSETELSEAQNKVLARGLNFAAAPTALPKEDFVVATEKACSQMNPDEAEELRSEVTGILRSADDPKPNLTKVESQALIASITVFPADKDRVTVIVEKTDHEQKVQDMLDDDRTYEKMKKDPTANYRRKLVSILTRLKDEGKISRELYSLYSHLYSTSEKVQSYIAFPRCIRKAYLSDLLLTTLGLLVITFHVSWQTS